MQTDPIIDEIRKVRSAISGRFDHDPKKLVEHYMKLQEKHKERLEILPFGETMFQPRQKTDVELTM